VDRSLGRIVRAIRHRLGWRQADLARRAGVSARAVSKLERHGPTGFTVRTLQRICEPIEIDLWVNGRWRGGELDRLLDAGHAALQELVTGRLESAAWQVRAEVTFSRFGERGSIDLLAFHPASGILLVVEIKTVIADMQGLLRPLDVKVRLAEQIAADLTWHATGVVPALILSEDSTSRRRVAQHPALFGRFAFRGRAAGRWLREPTGAIPGLLLFVRSSGGTGSAASRPGRRGSVRQECRREQLQPVSGRGNAQLGG
jgi:transcriptional regulator with XRE-family HTH domain